MAVTLTTSYQLICSKSTSTYSTLRLYARYTNRSITDNTTTIQFQARLYGNGGSGSFSSGTIKITSTGSSPSSSSSNLGSTSYSKGSETTLKTWTTTASHATDGTFTNKSVSAVLTSTASPNGTASGTITAPPIARKNNITVSTGNINDDSNTIKINLGNNSNSFTNTVKWSYDNGTTYSIVTDVNGDSLSNVVSGTYYFKPPSSLLALIPNDSSIKLKFTNTTYNGPSSTSPDLGTTDPVETTASVGDSYKPTYSNAVKTETNTIVSSAIGSTMQKVILNLSKPRYQLDLQALGSSTLSSALVKCGEQTKTIGLSGTTYSLDYTFENPMTSNVVIITITDSRGLSTEYKDEYGAGNYDIYTPFTIDTQSVARTDIGTGEVTLSFGGTLQQYKLDGTTPNTMVASVKYSNDGGETWTTYGNLTATISGTNWSINDSSGRWAVYNQNFTVEITFTDGVGTTTKLTKTITKAVPTFSAGEKDLQINGDLYLADEDGNNVIDVRDALENSGNPGVVLYENSSGSSGNIYLSDSSANYDYLEIYYRSNDGDYSYVKVNEPDGKTVALLVQRATTATPRVYGKTRTISISGSNITTVANSTSQYTINNSATGYVQVQDYILITKVIGYTNNSIPNEIEYSSDGEELYVNPSGTNVTLTLSDNVSNYHFLEIFYGWNGGSFGLCSTRVDLSTSGLINLSQMVHNNNYLYFATSRWTASGTSLTYSAGEYWRIGTSGSPTRNTSTHNIAVYKVIGYK